MASSSRRREMIVQARSPSPSAEPVPLRHPSAAAFLDLHAARGATLAGTAPAWLGAFRERGAAVLSREGFPTRRNEAWHYTDLRPFTTLRFSDAPGEPSAVSALPDGIAEVDAPRLVFVDGRFCPALSDLLTLPQGVSVRSLADAFDQGDPILRDRLGSHADAELGAFVALNAMLAEDGVLIECGAEAQGARLHLVSIGTGAEDAPRAYHLRHLVHVAGGARMTLFESALGATAGSCYLNNTVTEIGLDAGATLTHVRLQGEAISAFQVNTVAVTVGEAAEYDSFVLATGARLARNEVHATLAGAGATAHLNGAQLGDGVRHVDTTTVITHAAPACASRQTFKSVLSGRSRAVFQGKIHVHQAAQKTDGYQMNQALLLSPEAEIDAKPQLEIYADDVKCSHGATVGELDADQLFYLRSRGLPVPEARALLIEAFLADALEAVRDEALRAALAGATAAWWARAHSEAGA